MASSPFECRDRLCLPRAIYGHVQSCIVIYNDLCSFFDHTWFCTIINSWHRPYLIIYGHMQSLITTFVASSLFRRASTAFESPTQAMNIMSLTTVTVRAVHPSLCPRARNCLSVSLNPSRIACRDPRHNREISMYIQLVKCGLNIENRP